MQFSDNFFGIDLQFIALMSINANSAWTLRLVPAVLIRKTLTFKFSRAYESVGLSTDFTT